LAGRRVVVVGAGDVVRRRLPKLIESGADLTVIAPIAAPSIVELAARGELTWMARPYQPGDLAGAWYVLVASDDAACNQAVSAEADGERIFCVRADAATEASAWTPATGVVDGVTVGVLAGGDPRRAIQIRDALVATLSKLAHRAA